MASFITTRLPCIGDTPSKIFVLNLRMEKSVGCTADQGAEFLR